MSALPTLSKSLTAFALPAQGGEDNTVICQEVLKILFSGVLKFHKWDLIFFFHSCYCSNAFL